MHDTALLNAKRFFQTYAQSAVRPLVVDIGSKDVNGSLKSVCPPTARYVGVDFAPGRGVDIVLADPYALPIESGSADFVVSSSTFEHSEFFWLLFLEVMRVLKPTGLFYLNVPANGDFHRHPVDCWRFYPDSANALAKWGRRNGLRIVVLEQYTGRQRGDGWNDYVAIFLKDEDHISRHPNRILSAAIAQANGSMHPHEEFVSPSSLSEDQRHRPLTRLRKWVPQTRIYQMLK